MKKLYKTLRLTSSYCVLALAGIAMSQTAQASEKFELKTELKVQNIFEDNADLGTRTDVPTSDTTSDLRFKLFYRPADNIEAFVEARYLRAVGIAQSEDETGQTSAGNSFLEWRQHWIKFDNLFNIPSLAIQAGRQRIREDRTIWWNRDFDALRVAYDSTLFSGFAGVGQNLRAYRTSGDDFREDDEDRLRVFGEGSWQLNPDQAVDLRFLYENDYSGSESVGQFIEAANRDDEDAELLWVGGRFSGKMNRDGKAAKKIVYRADIMAVAGEETILSSSAGPTAELRTVTASRDRDVLGWAIDAAVDVVLDVPLSPLLTFGYAFGSGDDNAADGTNSAFRQTGLQGNSSRLHQQSQGTMRNYGEVFRPELSNIHILTAGVNVPVLDASDVNVVYHYYRLDQEITGLRSSGISASLTGTDSYLGQELDVVTNIHIGKEMGWDNPILKKTVLKISVGAFKAGDAYGLAEGEVAWRGLSELKLRF